MDFDDMASNNEKKHDGLTNKDEDKLEKLFQVVEQVRQHINTLESSIHATENKNNNNNNQYENWGVPGQHLK